jgi:glutamyl-Q tRNA(Asp) synthetase
VDKAVDKNVDAIPVSRFAPSPTGPLHLGHGWSAILAHDHARQAGGRFLLRIEDTDVTRCRPEYTHAILEDLAWLGFTWDALTIQSERLALYDAALERLKAMGMAYPCFCTRGDIAREVQASLHAPHGADGPLYPGTCRALSPEARAARMGEPHSWRLDAAAAIARTGPLHWWDATAGAVPADIHALGDLVLKGKDRPASYHLAVVVDDADQGVTDVVRGADVFASTHAHRLLQALLDLPSPRYHHHRLVGDAAGVRLAKRSHAPALADLRAQGMEGKALAAMLRAGRLPIGFRFVEP